MTLAARLIGLAFILLGLFLLVSQADAEGHRLGLAAVLFGGSIWLVDFGLSAHGDDLARGRAHRTRTGLSAFGPCRVRLGLMALATLCFGATAPLISGGLLTLPSLLLAGPLFLCGLVLAAWALDPRPLVVIDAEGVWDRRIMRRPAPWSAITAIDDEEGVGDILLRCVRVEAWRREGRWTAYGRGPDGFVVQTLLLDGDADDLMAAIRAMRPALSLAAP